MKKQITELLPEVEMHNAGEIPEGWTKVLLGDVCTHPQYGWTTCTDHNPDGLKIVRTSDISSGKIDWSTVPSCVLEPDNIEKYLLKSGDILISRAGSVGMSYKIQDCPRAVFASYLIRFRALDSIDTDYLEYFLKSRQYWDSIANETIGITIPNVNASKLKNIPIPLPPLSEQRRIVARIEALLAQVNAARDRLSRVPLIMRRFRQAVLAAACEGRLTEGWREDNPEFKSKHCERTNVEIPEDWEIPEEWQLLTIDEVCEKIVDCPHSTPKWTQLGKICIRTSEIKPCYLDLSNARFVSEETYRERVQRLEPKEGDIVFSREGTLGQAAIIPKGVDICLGQRIMQLRVGAECSPFFLTYLINSPQIQKIVIELTTGSTSPHVNVGDVKKFPVPLPPLAEQQEIVHRVNALFERADAFDLEVVAASRRCERLTQAVLGKAFAGKL
ncbi:MAG: restriction endonuclease subunit S [Methanoregula sp.]|jgi:type I restriction enzyme S subunit|nr:restriction endonuclease subunit S [Methanoregula sp.]